MKGREINRKKGSTYEEEKKWRGEKKKRRKIIINHLYTMEDRQPESGT
jgi:hypothetical protein